MDSFVRQYLETALWSSNDNSNDQGGDPLDKNYTIDDIAPETIAQAISDCARFRAANQIDLIKTGDDDEQNGHDFWLTRNRHGAGFWDRGYGDVGKRLTDACHVLGEVDLYVGDDGKVYGS